MFPITVAGLARAYKFRGMDLLITVAALAVLLATFVFGRPA